MAPGRAGMIEALTEPTLWGSLGVIALAVWAGGRIATHLTGNPRGVQIVARLVTPVALVFALTFVLMGRFHAWRVALGLAGAGVLAVLVFAIVGTRTEGLSGHGMAGVGVLATARSALVVVPLAVSVCSLLAWLVRRYPPAPLAWGIVVVALCAAAAWPTVARLRSPDGDASRGDASVRSPATEHARQRDLPPR